MKRSVSLFLVGFVAFIARITVAALHAFLIDKNNCQEHFFAYFSSSIPGSSSLVSLNSSEYNNEIQGWQRERTKDILIPVLQQRDIEEDALPFFPFSSLSEEASHDFKGSKGLPMEEKGKWERWGLGNPHGPWWISFLSMLRCTFLWDHTGFNSALYWREWWWWTAPRSFFTKSEYSGVSFWNSSEGAEAGPSFPLLSSSGTRSYIRSQLPWWCSMEYPLLSWWWSSNAIFEWKDGDGMDELSYSTNSPPPTTLYRSTGAPSYPSPRVEEGEVFSSWQKGEKRKEEWVRVPELVRLVGSVLSPATVALSALDGLTTVFVGALLLDSTHPSVAHNTNSYLNHCSISPCSPFLRVSSCFPLFSSSPFSCWCALLFGFVWNPVLVLLPLYESMLSVECFAIFGCLYGTWMCFHALFSSAPHTPFFIFSHIWKWMRIIVMASFTFFCALLLGVEYSSHFILLLLVLGTQLGFEILDGVFRALLSLPFCGLSSSPVCVMYVESVLRATFLYVYTATVFIGTALILWISRIEGSSVLVRAVSLDVYPLLASIGSHLFWFSFSTPLVLWGDRRGYESSDHLAPSFSPYWYARTQLPYLEYQEALGFLLLLTPVWIIVSAALLCFLFLRDGEGEEEKMNERTNKGYVKGNTVNSQKKTFASGDGSFSNGGDGKRKGTVLEKEFPPAGILHDPSRALPTEGTPLEAFHSSIVGGEATSENKEGEKQKEEEEVWGRWGVRYRMVFFVRMMELLPQLALLLSLCFKSSLLLPHLAWILLLWKCRPPLSSSHTASSSGFPCGRGKKNSSSPKKNWTTSEKDQRYPFPSEVRWRASKLCKKSNSAPVTSDSDSMGMEMRMKKGVEGADVAREYACHVHPVQERKKAFFSVGSAGQRWRAFLLPPRTTTTSIDTGRVSSTPSHITFEVVTLCVACTAVATFASSIGVGYSWLIQGYYLSVIFFFNELLFTVMLLGLLCLWLWERCASFQGRACVQPH